MDNDGFKRLLKFEERRLLGEQRLAERRLELAKEANEFKAALEVEDRRLDSERQQADRRLEEFKLVQMRQMEVECQRLEVESQRLEVESQRLEVERVRMKKEGKAEKKMRKAMKKKGKVGGGQAVVEDGQVQKVKLVATGSVNDDGTAADAVSTGSAPSVDLKLSDVHNIIDTAAAASAQSIMDSVADQERVAKPKMIGDVHRQEIREMAERLRMMKDYGNGEESDTSTASKSSDDDGPTNPEATAAQSPVEADWHVCSSETSSFVGADALEMGISDGGDGMLKSKNVDADDAGVQHEEEGLSLEEIDLVMLQAGVSRAVALKGLKENGGDVVKTILELAA
ncbi:hypothetical protein HK101_011163 [Irineochytrium annulatum]|nr:hypothetical protein HK101_011163 [Irineochytrium annulatum]